MKRTNCVALAVAALVLAIPAARAQDNEAPTLKIVSIMSERPAKPGVETKFTLEIRYEYDVSEEGEINVGFNSEHPVAFRMCESKIVARGEGTVVIEVTVIPVDWQDRGRFSAMVNLSELPHKSSWQPLAWDQREIQLER